MVGTLQVCSFEALVLYDPSSTHSYFASRFGEQPIMLDCPFWVNTLMGESLMVQLVVQSCVVNVNRVDMFADLLLL